MTYGSNRVFIGGISGSVTRDQIEAEFSKFGKLNSVWVAQNPPGFAFVEFDDTRDAEEAVKSLNGARLFSSNEIRVEHSRQRQGGGGGGPDRRQGGGMRNRLGNNGGGFRQNFRGQDGGGGFRGNDRQGGGYRNRSMSSGGGGGGGMGGSRYNPDGGNSFSRYESDGGIGRFNPLATSDRPARNRYSNNPGMTPRGNRFNGGNGGSGSRSGYSSGGGGGGQYGGGSQSGGYTSGGGGGGGNYRSRSPIDNFSNNYGAFWW